MRLLLATAALFLALATSASALTVIPGGGDPVVVNLADVPPNAGNAVSLDGVLAHLGIDPYDFKSFEVGTGDDEVLLSRAQATRSDGPPVFYEDGAGTHFDPGAGGDVVTGDLTLRLTADSPLEVNATASPKRVEAGELVRFRAEDVRAPSGEKVTFKWNFDDNDRAAGASVRHRFEEPGTYDVIVGMTTPSDRVGVSDIVTVRVGKETGGPDRPGGGTNDDAAAPDSGAATGGSGGGGGAAGDSGQRTADSGDSPKPEPKKEPQPAAEPVNTVEGVLLASSTTPLAAPQREAARTGTPRDDSDSRSVPGWVWAVLAVAVLLGSGLAVDRGRLARLNWGTPSP